MNTKSKILIVDDSSTNIIVVKTVLEHLDNIEIISATNGNDALEAAQLHQFAVAILDVQMPEMDGFELAERLRNAERTKNLPIIFLSAIYSSEEYVFKGYQSGAVDYMTKPFEPHSLESKIHVFVELDRQKKQLEAANQQLQKEIEKRIKSEEKRAQLELQLRLSERMKALGTLSAGIAHDFNNILFSIQGFSQLLLLEHTLEPDAKEYIEKILHATKRAVSVIKQLITFALSGENSFAPIQISPVIENALNTFKVGIPANIQLQQDLDLGRPCPLVQGSAGQIQQAVVNICLNAKEAMEKDGGTLKVKLDLVMFDKKTLPSPHLVPGSYLQLKIQDTGGGISPEIQDFIFDPFFTTKGLGGTNIGPSKEGTGLGLYVTYNIMQAHQGIVKVESEEGLGAAFILYFPILENQITEME